MFPFGNQGGAANAAQSMVSFILCSFAILTAVAFDSESVANVQPTCPRAAGDRILGATSAPYCVRTSRMSRSDSGDEAAAPRPPAYAQAVAGAGGGLVTVLLLHPLDTLKTRLQSDDATRRTGAVRVLRGVVMREGVRALYSGAVPAVVGGACSWAFYMQWFHGVRDATATAVGGAAARPGPVSDFLAATSAGVVTAVATNPIWVVKVRLQLQRQHVRDAAAAVRVSGGVAAGAVGRGVPYTGFVHGLTSIAREEGMRGLYKGLVPSLWLVSHGAIQFAAYERLKAALVPTPGSTPSVQASLVASTTSKLAAAVMTYPLQLVRTRMQEVGASQQRYGSVMRGFGAVLREDGFRGLYRGLGANLVRVLPQTAVTFVTYEQILRLCIAWRSKSERSEGQADADA